MTANARGTACVYVVGMHRSGTSATAGALAQLGLGMPSGDDLVPAEQSNARGHWESRSLLRLSNRLFRHFGGTWSTPPLLPAGWQDDPSLDGLRAEARKALAAAFGPRPIVFKDPRLCITLPFWETVVEPPAAAVFVLRDPTEVAESLRARSGLRIVHALAMWDRHVRTAAANLGGLPTLVSDYAGALADPQGWCGRLVDFLAEVGVEVDPARRGLAETSLQPDLRHQVHRDAPPGPAQSSRGVFDALVARSGIHRPWQVLDLGPEPSWVGDVIELVSELESLRIAYSSLRRSRAFRVASTFWRLHDDTVPDS